MIFRGVKLIIVNKWLNVLNTMKWTNEELLKVMWRAARSFAVPLKYHGLLLGDCCLFCIPVRSWLQWLSAIHDVVQSSASYCACNKTISLFPRRQLVKCCPEIYVNPCAVCTELYTQKTTEQDTHTHPHTVRCITPDSSTQLITLCN